MKGDKTVTLDRKDLLTRGIRGRTKADTVFASGYIVRSINSKRIYAAVLFSGNTRFKGYFDIADISKMLEGKLEKVTIKQRYPRNFSFNGK